TIPQECEEIEEGNRGHVTAPAKEAEHYSRPVPCQACSSGVGGSGAAPAAEHSVEHDTAPRPLKTGPLQRRGRGRGRRRTGPADPGASALPLDRSREELTFRATGARTRRVPNVARRPETRRPTSLGDQELP